MGVRERCRNRAQHVGAFFVRENAVFHAGQKLCQVEAVDILHDQVGVRAVGLEVVDRHYVGVGEEAGRACLRQRLVGRGDGDAVRILAGQEGYAFDCHPALQARVPAGAYGAKAASPSSREHAVAPKERLLGNGMRAGPHRPNGALCGVGAAHGDSLLCVCGLVSAGRDEDILPKWDGCGIGRAPMQPSSALECPFLL